MLGVTVAVVLGVCVVLTVIVGVTLGVCVGVTLGVEVTLTEILGVIDGVVVGVTLTVTVGVGVTAPNNPYGRTLNPPTVPNAGAIYYANGVLDANNVKVASAVLIMLYAYASILLILPSEGAEPPCHLGTTELPSIVWAVA